jgi:hypothetical protein
MPYLPDECDTPESQRDYFEDLARAQDAEDLRRPDPRDEM